jgi:hypothetical protein
MLYEILLCLLLPLAAECIAGNTIDFKDAAGFHK